MKQLVHSVYAHEHVTRLELIMCALYAAIFTISTILFIKILLHTESTSSDYGFQIIYILPVGILYIAQYLNLCFNACCRHHSYRGRFFGIIYGLITAAISAILLPIFFVILRYKCFDTFIMDRDLFNVVLQKFVFGFELDINDRFFCLSMKIIQITFVILSLFYHFFTLDKYGYYSLILFILCMFHWLLCGMHLVIKLLEEIMYHWGQVIIIFYIQFILGFIAICVAFFIDYTDYIFYDISLTAFILYILSLSQVFFYEKYRQLGPLYRFVTKYSACSKDAANRLYAYYHYLAHTNIVSNNYTETSHLINNLGIQHEENSVQCIEDQYKFIQMGLYQKHKKLKRLFLYYGPNINIFCHSVKIVMYLFLVLCSYLYYIWWFLYLWIYCFILKTQNVFELTENQQVSIWFLFALYLILCIYCIFKYAPNVISLWHLRMIQYTALLESVPSDTYMFQQIDYVRIYYQNQCIVETLLDIDYLHIDIAFQILLFLGTPKYII
eukprot:70346_1